MRLWWHLISHGPVVTTVWLRSTSLLCKHLLQQIPLWFVFNQIMFLHLMTRVLSLSMSMKSLTRKFRGSEVVWIRHMSMGSSSALCCHDRCWNCGEEYTRKLEGFGKAIGKTSHSCPCLLGFGFSHICYFIVKCPVVVWEKFSNHYRYVWIEEKSHPTSFLVMTRRLDCVWMFTNFFGFPTRPI
jgi:hypothetical protein